MGNTPIRRQEKLSTVSSSLRGRGIRGQSPSQTNVRYNTKFKFVTSSITPNLSLLRHQLSYKTIFIFFYFLFIFKHFILIQPEFLQGFQKYNSFFSRFSKYFLRYVQSSTRVRSGNGENTYIYKMEIISCSANHWLKYASPNVFIFFLCKIELS